MTPSSPLTDTETPATLPRTEEKGSTERSDLNEAVQDWRDRWMGRAAEGEAMVVDKPQATQGEIEQASQDQAEGQDGDGDGDGDGDVDGDGDGDVEMNGDQTIASGPDDRIPDLTARLPGHLLPETYRLAVKPPHPRPDAYDSGTDDSSITSATFPFFDSETEREESVDTPSLARVLAEDEWDSDYDLAPAGTLPTAAGEAVAGKTSGGDPADDSVSELTAFTDESEGEAGGADGDEDDEDEEEEEEEIEAKPVRGSAPPPNTNMDASAAAKTSPSQSAQKPPSLRKPSIFGPRSDEPDIQDDGEESELTDSERDFGADVTERRNKSETAHGATTPFSKGSKPISIKVTPAKTAEGDDAEDRDGPVTPTTTTAAVPAPRRLSKPADDEEKPYSPPKTAKKGILGRSAAGATEGETESIVSDDEEEDDDEGGQGMLVKDAVRRESEGKTKKTREDEDEEEEDKTVAEDRSVEERAASPSSTKSKRVSATPVPSSTSHLITNNLSSATTQTTLEALQALLQIEVKFAALRDQLYVERMDELSREEEIIADGTHPSLLHLHQILQDRRENLLHLAELRLKQNELELVRVRESDKKAVLSWWQDAKDTLVRDEYESNARKKRRLDKDKADYEIIKPAPRALPPKLPTRLDAEARTFAWGRGPSITALMQDEVANDLAKIGAAARSQYRQLHHGHRQQHVMAGYGRYAGEESAMMATDTGSLMFDPTGTRPIVNGAGHHHHVIPAASGSSQAMGSRHRHYTQTPSAYDMHAGAGQPREREREPRREGRQVPTSNSEPFDPRRRDRMEDPLLTGRIRRDVVADDARDTKRRKTGSDSPAPSNGLGHPPPHVAAGIVQDDPRRIPRRSPSPSQSSKASALKVNPNEAQSPGYGHLGGNASVASLERSLAWDYRWGPGASSRYPNNPRRPGLAAARN